MYKLSKYFVVFLSMSVSSASWALCTKSKKVNFRSGPGTHYKKTWTVSKYMPLEKVSQTRWWYQVKDFEGDYHWVLKSLISSKYKCVVVKKTWASLRTGPGKKFSRSKIYPKAEKYVTFKYVSKKKNWIKVKDKRVYWVYKPLVWIR